MFLLSLINEFAVYITFIALLLSGALWYYTFVFKPYAKIPSWRLEFRLPYWSLSGIKLDTELINLGLAQSKKYETEGLFIAWFFKPIVIAYGEEIMKCLVPYTADKPSTHKIFEFAYGKGIFTSNGERWKRHKKLISPAFHMKALKAYVSFMNKNAKDLAEKLSEKKGETVVDIVKVLSECTLKLFYESSFGVREGDSKEFKKSVEIVHKTVEFFLYRLLRPWFYFDFMLPILPYGREILKLDAENRKMNVQILEKIQESVANNNQSQIIEEESDPLTMKPKSIGEFVIEDHLRSPSLSMEDLAREMYFLIFAGFDTTSHTLMWTLYALGRHPEIQDRVYDEISTLAKEDDIQYADVQDLIYLDCVIKESLRLYSTVPVVPRVTTKDVRCGDYVIPKNTEVSLVPFILHRNPDIYPDPEKFDPERFINKDLNIKPWNYIPFAEGARPCLGKNYAMLSMKIILIHVLRNFKVVSLDQEQDLTFRLTFVLTTEKEPRMKFIPRL